MNKWKAQHERYHNTPAAPVAPTPSTQRPGPAGAGLKLGPSSSRHRPCCAVSHAPVVSASVRR